MNGLSGKFLSVLIAVCIVSPALPNSTVFAEEQSDNSFIDNNIVDETIYESQNFLAGAKSSSVTEFTYNNDNSLTYTVIKSASSNYKGEVEVKGNNSSMTSIKIPSVVYDNEGYSYSVTTIGAKGFYDYTKLKKVTIPRSVDTIKGSAFLDCTSLETIIIYSPRLYLYNKAFDNIGDDPIFYVQNSSVEDELLDYLDEDDVEIIIDDYDDDDDDDDDSDYYRVKLEAEKGGKVSGDGKYKEGKTVTIKATPNHDYVFDRWVVEDGDISLKDRYDEKTTFRMPDEKVTITAQFNYIGNDYYYYYNDRYYPYSSNSSNRNNINYGNQSGVTVRNNLSSISLDKFFTDEIIRDEDTVINLGNNSNVSTSEFEHVKATDNNIVFVLNGYKWIINGRDIATNITDKGYCNLGVNFKQTVDSNINSLSQNTSIAQFSLAYEGDLPFSGKLEFAPKDVVPKQPVYLYKYNTSSNTINYQDYDIADDNGVIDVKVDSSSIYVLTNQIIKDTYVVQRTNVNSVSLDTIIPNYNNNGEQELVTISGRDGNNIVFIAPETTTYSFVNNAKTFNDVQNHWAKSSIDYVSARNLFNGVSDNEFAPNSTITRGMFITALGNFHNIDTTWYEVGNNTVYYAPYVEWANDNGILDDINSTNFDEPITREEMAVILKNYSDYIGFNLPQASSNTSFADDAQISPTAKEAVSCMNKLGIINGKDGNFFNPTDEATRAEASVMFRRYIEAILHNQISNL